MGRILNLLAAFGSLCRRDGTLKEITWGSFFVEVMGSPDASPESGICSRSVRYGWVALGLGSRMFGGQSPLVAPHIDVGDLV